MPFSACGFARLDPTVSTFRQDAANAADFVPRGELDGSAHNIPVRPFQDALAMKCSA
jgi:hypothetical protein